MSFTQETLSKSSTGYAHKVSGQGWFYSSKTDTIAEIKSDGYFDDAAPLFSVGETFNVGDLTFERDLLEIIEINPTAPKVKTRGFISTGSIRDGSVTTPKLADLAVTTDKLDLAAVTIDRIDNLAVTTAKLAVNAVTLPKLSTGISPSDIVKFSQVFTTTGGNVAELFTLTGVLTTDFVLTSIISGGTNSVIIKESNVPSNDTVRIEFSLDPIGDTILLIVALRLAT